MPTEELAALNDALGEKALRDRLTVGVLTNAKFHISIEVKEKRPVSEERGMLLHRLPPYTPRLDFIHALWKHVRNFLLSRRS